MAEGGRIERPSIARRHGVQARLPSFRRHLPKLLATAQRRQL